MFFICYFKFNRFFIFLVCFMGMSFSAASMVGSKMQILKNKKKHSLAPSITSLVSNFQLDISILSIFCTQNKILEPLWKKCQYAPPTLPILSNFLFSIDFSLCTCMSLFSLYFLQWGRLPGLQKARIPSASRASQIWISPLKLVILPADKYAKTLSWLDSK